ncbi:MAG TPA: DUF4276 family protein [Rubrivivax sp.]|nr:DUF4276 family protein [Rubrivivax sp.]
MAIDSLHVLVEEPSMEVALQHLLPRLLREGIQVELRQFQSKSELLTHLPQRLAGYAKWLPDAAVLLVLVDRDDDDCAALKARLDEVARSAGLVPRSDAAAGARFHVINRIAVEELEAWFFGDWPAVCAAYPKMPATLPKRAGFRDPDAIAGGTWEALERELQRKGYFKQGLRKLELAHEVASRMNPARNRSASFECLRAALAQL